MVHGMITPFDFHRLPVSVRIAIVETRAGFQSNVVVV
jgi:hypothetical protein